MLLLTGLRIYKYTLISHNRNEQRVCMALFFITLSWFVIFLLQSVHVTDIQAKDTILLVFMLTYQDNVRCCVIRMCKMVHIGFEVVLFYILLTLFFGIFNRVSFYHMAQEDIQDSDKIWMKWGSSSLPRALNSIFSYTPGSSFPDYMVGLFKMNRLAGWIIPIEMFIRGAIMLAIVQSSLYFYYQNFYVKTLATLRADKRLYFVISREFVERGDVPPQELLRYIVRKYCENEDHTFGTDDEFTRIKDKLSESENAGKKNILKRKCFYEENFEKPRAFLESNLWVILIVIADVIQLVCVLVYTEYLYYEVIRKQIAVEKSLDAKEKTKLFHDLIVSYNTAYWLIFVAWVINLLPTIDGFLKLVTRGFSATFRGNKGEIIKFVSVFFIFMITTVNITFDSKWLTP
jgi:hypothetical protein